MKNWMLLCLIYFSVQPSILAQTFQYRPIQYLEGDELDYPLHAWLVIDHPVLTNFQFLNAKATNPITETQGWLVKNLPFYPNATPRQIHYRMDIATIADDGLVPPLILIEYQVGPYQLDSLFPGIPIFLSGIPEDHMIKGGGYEPHSYIPYIPPILLPPILPDTIEYMTRECDVPNIDLDSLAHPDPVSGDYNSCAPAAAANSLKWLMDVHPELPEVDSLRGILDTLEMLMGKDEAGVVWDTIVMGKLAFIDKHQLPISVKYQVHTPNPDFKPYIHSPDPTYGHAAENQTGPTNVPDFDWLQQELEAGEDVEMVITYFCDSAGVRVKRSTHAINITGYFEMGNDKWLIWKHDTDQTGPGGTVEEYGRWCTDAAGYPFLKEMSETDDCVANVGAVISESYDPSVIFCPVKVCNDQDDGEGSLREALICNEPGRTIMIGSELANVTIQLTSTPIHITQSLTLTADITNNITISASTIDRVFVVAPGVTVTLEGIKLICGTASAGACIITEANLHLNNMTILNSQGIFIPTLIQNTGGNLTISGTTNVLKD